MYNIFTLGKLVTKSLFILFTLPFYILVKTIKQYSNPDRTNLRFKDQENSTFKTLLKLTIVLVTIPAWCTFYLILIMFLKNITFEKFNLVEDRISISGTGSMYPTFPKGQSNNEDGLRYEVVASPYMQRFPSGIQIFGHNYFDYTIQRGDIVDIYSAKTKEITSREGEPAGFVKRVVGLPGDQIEIRDGLVYINSQPLSEPYIARARSTFGGEFVKDCTLVTVPENKLFVMGDNRKGSLDSRHELGFVDILDINHVIPYKKQVGVLDTGWRDASRDLADSSKISLDKNKYLDLLNIKRVENGIKPLKYQDKLEKSATLRANTILKYDDLSFEATKSGYTMLKAVTDARYSNIVYGESPVYGYYEAEELIENQFEFSEIIEFLLNKDYQDFGIAEVEGIVNGCPTQIVVQHFAGYKPPNYSNEDINGWKQILTRLKEIQPGWVSAQNSSQFYTDNKTDIDRINEVINIRIGNIESIVNTITRNEWLSDNQLSYIEEDKRLSGEQEQLAQKINGLIE